MLYIQVVLLFISVTLGIGILFPVAQRKNWLKLGKAAIAQQNFELAIHYFSKELLENPENIYAYLERAKAYSLNGDLDKSNKDRRRAYELDPYLIFQITLAEKFEDYHSNQPSSYPLLNILNFKYIRL